MWTACIWAVEIKAGCQRLCDLIRMRVQYARKAFGIPVLGMDGQNGRAAGCQNAQHFCKRFGSDVPMGEGSGTDDTCVMPIQHIQPGRQIALEQPAVDV